jgi:hypothetical protein
MDLSTGLVLMFFLGLIALGAMFAFVIACDNV